MSDSKKEKKVRREPAEFFCPKCNRTEIIYIPVEKPLRCSQCGREMVLKELLVEGKSY